MSRMLDRDRVIAVYADGGCIQKNPSPYGVMWAWCGVNADDQRIVERGGVIPSTPTRQWTNNIAEQVALVLALEAMPDGWSGMVCSDSQIALGRLFKDWRTRNLPENVTRRGHVAIARLGVLEPVLLQGHPSAAELATGVGSKNGFPVSAHNVWADKKCQQVGRDYYVSTFEMDSLQRLSA